MYWVEFVVGSRFSPRVFHRVLRRTELQGCDHCSFNLFRTHVCEKEKLQKHARKALLLPLSQSLVSSKQGYKNWVKNNGPETLLPGLNMTNEQLLFVSFGQVGRRNLRRRSILDIPILLHISLFDVIVVETGMAL